jgi:hypothetical protein
MLVNWCGQVGFEPSKLIALLRLLRQLPALNSNVNLNLTPGATKIGQDEPSVSSLFLFSENFGILEITDVLESSFNKFACFFRVPRQLDISELLGSAHSSQPNLAAFCGTPQDE